MKKWILFLVLPMCVGPAAAAEWYGPVKVKELMYYDAFSWERFSKLPAVCTQNAKNWLASANYHNDLWAIVNTAYIKNVDVWIWYENNNGNCRLQGISTAKAADRPS